MSQNFSYYTLSIKGLDCPDCASKIENSLRNVDGLRNVTLNFNTANLHFELDPKKISLEQVEKRMKRMGYGINKNNTSGQLRPYSIILTVLSGILILSALFLTWLNFSQTIIWALYILAILSSGYPIAKKGVMSIYNLNLDMNFLMTLAIVGALAIGELAEAASIVFLFSLAQLLEERTMDRAREAIRSLMKLTPKVAKVKKGQEEISIKVEDLSLGDIVIIRPGEKIPVDGVVVTGSSWVDQAPITGESKPIGKKPQEKVFAGTINLAGSLEVSVDHLANDSTLARIIHMVEEAQSQRAPSQNFVDRFAKIYTPAMILLAGASSLVPPLVFGQEFLPWLYRALVLLVISCPCALVISTPVSIISSLTAAARRGILIKGGVHLENIGAVKAIAFDKTGTLTKGKPSLLSIIALNGCSSETALKIASTIESRSEHPLAAAVMAKAEKEGILPERGSDFEAMPGLGAKMKINGELFYLGNHRLFEELKLCDPGLDETLEELEDNAETALILGSEKGPLAIMAIADELRDNISMTIKELNDLGIEKMLLITGDNLATAKAIAGKSGISEYRGELLPDEKVAVIEDLVKGYGKVAMVGDGINDTPSLARATVGLTVGQTGTDTALETADITLMADDLSLIPLAIRLGKRTLATIKTNIAFAILVKAVFFILALAGWSTLWMAIAADMGASLLVTFNGLRLLKIKS